MAPKAIIPVKAHAKRYPTTKIQGGTKAALNRGRSPLTFPKRRTMGTIEGSIMAAIIVVHMSRNGGRETQRGRPLPMHMGQVMLMA